MAGGEIELEFFLAHLTELATDASSTERLRAADPATLQPFFDTLFALRSMSIRDVTDHLRRANEATRKFSEDIARLNVQTSQRVTEQGKEMDARLDALITIVERHITNPKAHEGEE